jgi:ribosomal protein S18 acetylase RimI-like enzyme
MPWTVRLATPADAAVIVEFNRLMALETEGHELDLTLIGPGVATALADPAKCRYFLAVENGMALGQMGLTTEWSDWRNGWFWWIQSVFVRPEYRRRGVFRSLFEHVQAAARSSPQVIGLRLYVERDNHAAQKTYESLGMKETGYLLLEKYPL